MEKVINIMQSVKRELRHAHTCIKQLLQSLCSRTASLSRSRTSEKRTNVPSETHRSTMDIRESISKQTEVSILLAKHVVSTKAQDANLVFSPLSIHVVLGLNASGSKGPTLDQLLSFLKVKVTEEINSLSSQLVTLVFADGGSLGGPRLSFANSVWVDQSLNFKPSFKETVDNAYKAAASHVDFQTKEGDSTAVEATKEVNLWAEKETSGLIKEILPSGSVDGSTRLIFANAVYFKGAWNEMR
ncbi:Serpin-ZX [Forsythia ovata]|uniref:Serpin-ZX n=1 Tax=Forsythia ovata TaxID=205694 RepID=A0ABD1P5H7_9LAMI